MTKPIFIIHVPHIPDAFIAGDVAKACRGIKKDYHVLVIEHGEDDLTVRFELFNLDNIKPAKQKEIDYLIRGLIKTVETLKSKTK